jgi:subtilisin family serine protease
LIRVPFRPAYLAAIAALSSLVFTSGIVTGSSSKAAGTSTPAPVGTVGQLVVKLVAGADVAPINRLLGSTTRSVLLASRGIYLLDVPFAANGKEAAKQRADWKDTVKKLIDRVTKNSSVIYAEANTEADIADIERFHIWPSGGPNCLGADAPGYTAQPAATRLQLSAIHQRTRGTGQVVAILDTGLDLRHPALATKIAPGGYDYVDDDASPEEIPGIADHDGDTLSNEGYGHGTFVAGVVSLVAPQARLLPMRVLDAEGRGNVFVVAEALYDATAHGADVINMSFGTVEHTDSKVLKEAIKDAVHSGSVVVAAAGNDGSDVKHYPAAIDGVTSVAALDVGGTALATFSAQGKWVDVAAPGEDVISTLPCGYGSWSGTSMASPFVAGEAALLAGSGAKNRTADHVRKALEDGTDRSHKINVRTGSIDIVRSLAKV